jgi:hypothetical protein
MPRRKRQTDAKPPTWVEKFSKESTARKTPTWFEMFDALERKYGKGKVPCNTYDSAREKFFREFVVPWVMKENLNSEAIRQDFTQRTDLGTPWTITGRKRKGCLE